MSSLLLAAMSVWFVYVMGWGLAAMIPGAISTIWGTVAAVAPGALGKTLRKRIEKLLFARRFPAAWACVAVGWLAATTVVRSVIVHSEDERLISIGREAKMAPYAVPKLGEKRVLFFAAPFIPTTVWVSDERLPKLRRDLSAWHVAELWCPRDLIRPVLLLRPSRGLIAMTGAPRPPIVKVLRRNELIAHVTLNGHSVLIGAPDIAIPDALRQSWTDELRAEDPRVKDLWLTPVVASPEAVLRPEDELAVEVRFDDGSLRNRYSVVCIRPRKPEDLPQVIDLL